MTFWSQVPLTWCDLVKWLLESRYLDGIYGGPEHWVVELHCSPVLGPGGVGQVAAVLLQNVQGGGQTLYGHEGLDQRQR